MERSSSLSVTTDEDKDTLPRSQLTTYDFEGDSSRPRRHGSLPMHCGEEPSRAPHSPSHASKERIDLNRIETAKRSQPDIAQSEEESVTSGKGQSLPNTPPQTIITFPPGLTQDRSASSEDYGEPGKTGNAHQTSTTVGRHHQENHKGHPLLYQNASCRAMK